jgi:hypothetical protein
MLVVLAFRIFGEREKIIVNKLMIVFFLNKRRLKLRRAQIQLPSRMSSISLYDPLHLKVKHTVHLTRYVEAVPVHGGSQQC